MSWWFFRQLLTLGFTAGPSEDAAGGHHQGRRTPDNRRPSFEPHEFAHLQKVSLGRLVDPIMDGSGAMVEASDKRRWRIKRLDDHTRVIAPCCTLT